METRISDELLKHLEGLAKFELSEQERVSLKKDIEEILQIGRASCRERV